MQNAVRDLRERAGLSQADCADALGVSRQTVISIEKGHFDPRLFDVSVDEVFTPET